MGMWGSRWRLAAWTALPGPANVIVSEEFGPFRNPTKYLLLPGELPQYMGLYPGFGSFPYGLTVSPDHPT